MITLTLLKACRSMAGQASPRRRSLWCHPAQGTLAAWERGCSGDTATPAEVGRVLTARCRCGCEGLWPCHLQGKTSPTDSEIPCTVGRVVVL